jgi:hypothetical protein
MAEFAPWVTLAGLGAYHGLNPAMGWLFAVALGLHRQSQRVVLASLWPIALGHAAAVAAVLLAVIGIGLVADTGRLSHVAGLVLIAWAGWHALFGHRQRVRIGMQASLVGLAVWSFLMASAHGAGLMLIPVLLPLCGSGPSGELTASGSLPIAAAALGVHTAAMLAVIAAVSTIVFRWTGLAFLRRGWINLDLLWTVALAGTGVLLLVR